MSYRLQWRHLSWTEKILAVLSVAYPVVGYGLAFVVDSHGHHTLAFWICVITSVPLAIAACMGP